MKRNGFGIIFAIIVLVLVSTIAVYTLSLSSKTVKSVSNEHIKLQLELYRNSAIEYAILWMNEDKTRSQNPNGSDLNISFDNYHFQVKMFATTLTDIPESNGSVILDIVGRTDVDIEPIIVARRVVVKP